jgi:uncharacterized protein HemY
MRLGGAALTRNPSMRWARRVFLKTAARQAADRDRVESDDRWLKKAPERRLASG